MEQTPPAPPPIEAPPPVQAETPAPPVPPVSAEPAVSQPSQETEVELVNDELGDIVINPDIAYQLYDPSISESQYTRLLGQDNFHEIDLGGPLEPLDFNDKQAVGIYNKAFAKHQSLIEGTESDIMYGQIVGDAAGANDISSAILAGVFHTESRYNKNAGTYNQFDKSAQGPFQFTQQTADHVGLKNRNSVIESANAASKYLRELLDRFDGDIVTALRAYNAGPGAIEDMQNRFGVNYLILTDKNVIL